MNGELIYETPRDFFRFWLPLALISGQIGSSVWGLVFISSSLPFDGFWLAMISIHVIAILFCCLGFAYLFNDRIQFWGDGILVRNVLRKEKRYRYEDIAQVRQVGKVGANVWVQMTDRSELWLFWFRVSPSISHAILRERVGDG